jgi:hypothetical protein
LGKWPRRLQTRTSARVWWTPFPPVELREIQLLAIRIAHQEALCLRRSKSVRSTYRTESQQPGQLRPLPGSQPGRSARKARRIAQAAARRPGFGSSREGRLLRTKLLPTKGHMSHGSRPGLAEHFEVWGWGVRCPSKRRGLLATPAFDSEASKGHTMQRKPFIFLMLLTMSVASRAATDDFDSFMGVGWVWILALSLYAVFGGILLLAFCHTAADSDAPEDKTYEAILKKARAPQGLSNVDSRSVDRWSPRPNRLDLNLADFAPQFLDIHILSSDDVVVRVDDVVDRSRRTSASLSGSDERIRRNRAMRG